MLDFKSVSKVLPGVGFTGRDVKEVALTSLGLPPAVLKALLGGPATAPPAPVPAPAPPTTTPMFGKTETDRILQSVGKLEKSSEAQNRKVISTLKRGFGLDEFDKVRAAGGEKGALSGLLDRLLGGGRAGARSIGAKVRSGASRLSRLPGAGLAARAGAGLLSAGLAGWFKYSDLAGREDLTTGQKAAQVGSTAAGAGLGALGGAAAGAALGSFVPVVGTVVGGLIGAAVGGWLGGKGGEVVGEKISDNLSNIKDGASRLWSQASTALTVTLPGAIEKRVTNVIGKEAAERVGSAAKTVVEAGVKAVVAPMQLVKAAAGVAAEAAAGARSVMTKVATSIEERWNQAKGLLASAAQSAGVDPRVLARIANFESRFDPSARPVRRDGTRISSAHGYGQFLDATWVKMVQQYGEKYGLAGAKGFSTAQALSYRNDPQLQANLLAEFTKRNVELGRRYGGESDDANVYALHNLGESAGAKFLKALKSNPSAAVSQILSPAVVSGNKSLYGDGGITVREAYERMMRKMAEGEAYAREIGDAAMSVREARDPGPGRAQPAPEPSPAPAGALVGQIQLKDVPLSPMDPMLASVNTGALSK